VRYGGDNFLPPRDGLALDTIALPGTESSYDEDPSSGLELVSECARLPRGSLYPAYQSGSFRVALRVERLPRET
jgi:hypothetical protein